MEEFSLRDLNRVQGKMKPCSLFPMIMFEHRCPPAVPILKKEWKIRQNVKDGYQL